MYQYLLYIPMEYRSQMKWIRYYNCQIVAKPSGAPIFGIHIHNLDNRNVYTYYNQVYAY